MVVHPVNGAVPSTPLRPASTFSLASRMKRGGGARRALSTLGNNDAHANLRLAESLFTVSQEKFAKKWNFDPVKAEPLAPGRYLWTPVTSSITSPADSKVRSVIGNDKDILTCFTLPKFGFAHNSNEPRVPEIQGVAGDGTVPHETVRTPDAKVMDPNSSISSGQDNTDSGIETDESISESPVPARTSTTTQSSITDYLRCSKKRLLVVEDDDVMTLLPASKRHHLGGEAGPAHSTTTNTTPASVPVTPSTLHK